MKELALVGVIIALMACGKAATEPPAVTQLPLMESTVQGCSVQQTSVGAIITCQDGTVAVVLHGQNGHNGDKNCHNKK